MRRCDFLTVETIGHAGSPRAAFSERSIWRPIADCWPRSNPAGIQIDSIDVPGNTTNLAWGGGDGRTLFVTTSNGGVYSLALTVREAR